MSSQSKATMQSSKAEKNHKEISEDQRTLIQQFKDLEKQWESINRSRPQIPFRRFSTGYECSSNKRSTISFDRVIENYSPRSLMSSLQHQRSPYGNRDGKFKRRRLFADEDEDDEEDANEVELNNCSDNDDEDDDDNVEESERLKAMSSVKDHNTDHEFDDQHISLSPCSVFEEKTEVEVAEIKGGTRLRSGGGSGKRFLGVKAWFAFVLIVLILGVIAIALNGSSEFEQFLVPT